MPFPASRRFAGAVAVAGVILLATAPVSWGKAALESAALARSSHQQTTEPQQATDAADLDAAGDASIVVAMGDGLAHPQPCEPGPASQAAPGSAATSPAPPPAGEQPGLHGLQATFRLCGAADPQAERALEQLIAGRSFSATLVGLADGCADLTVKVSPQAAAVSGGSRQSSHLTVSSGSGGAAQAISVQIVSEHGGTRVRLGAAN